MNEKDKDIQECDLELFGGSNKDDDSKPRSPFFIAGLDDYSLFDFSL